ncbi:MAG: helix-turn-helix domain-containing protein [Sphingomicrobium sp.]
MQSEKITTKRSAEAKRRYDDACGTAHALDLIGERWALLVVRELMLGARRFSELKSDLPGISANVLTQRLTELEAKGLVRRITLPPPANVQVYEATEWGLEAEPLLQSLGRWAARSPGHDPSLPLSAVSLMLSFRTMIDPKRARKLDARVGFRFGRDTFVARLKKGTIKIARGPIKDCELLFEGPPTALAAVVYGGQPLEFVRITGSHALAEKFVTLFPLPLKVGADGH